MKRLRSNTGDRNVKHRLQFLEDYVQAGHDALVEHARAGQLDDACVLVLDTSDKGAMEITAAFCALEGKPTPDPANAAIVITMHHRQAAMLLTTMAPAVSARLADVPPPGMTRTVVISRGGTTLALTSSPLNYAQMGQA